MRILLMHHAPLAESPAGRLTWRWAQSLGRAGHDVRLLVVDDRHRDAEGVSVERVVCRAADPAADLPFDLPHFATDRGSPPLLRFADMSDAQLVQYRDHLRRRLDGLVDRFDPTVIHAQHIWALGQLGLETGVPYVLNAWDAELVESAGDKRFATLAEQAAENAGRILVSDDAMARRVAERFETSSERTLIMPPRLMADEVETSLSNGHVDAEQLTAIYLSVLEERFGRHG
jgi:hypothetical protein